MNRKILAKNLIYILFLTFLVSGFFAFFSKSALASSTDGTIDSSDKYSYGENIGWLNFGTTEGNIHITDSALTGYVWAENTGWISLNCSNDSSCVTVDYKIANDGEGTLSGYAWSENTGWINFNPTYGGVTINSSGEFSGYAWGENIGWIVFNCSTTSSCGTVDYKVKTDWRPQSARGGGAGVPIEYSSPPAPAAVSSGNLQGGFKVIINDGAEITRNRTVTLQLFAGADTATMAISNNSEFSGIGSTGQMAFQSSYEWDICRGIEKCVDGEYNVYIRFFTGWGTGSEVVSDGIAYQKEIIASPEEKPVPSQVEEPIDKLPTPRVESPTKPPTKPIVERIPEILQPFVPEFLKPKQPEEPPQVAIEDLVSKITPSVFRGKWQLLPSEPIKEFVLAPLPKAIRNLVQKFPELEKTLEEVGVSKITDFAKLKTVKLTLPGLTERAGLPTAKVELGKFALPQGIPVAELSPAIKQQLPTEIVFAKTGGELIDFNIDLSVTDKGEPQQKIATISGKPLQLVVKPDKPVKSVKGYLVFKSKASQPTSLEFPLNSLLASVIFANPVFAKSFTPTPNSFIPVEGAELTRFDLALKDGVKSENFGVGASEKPVRVEEKLVLLEFEYTDPDGDGIYTAEIQAPLVAGEYEIITVMDFDDPELGKKEIRLTTVVDPEGYVYERDGDKETRIPGAIISLFWLNPETKQYELWPAKKYQQENPQTTDVRGTYSFLVPEGYYYLKAETPGYLVYDGKPFQVKEGSGVHINIELKTKYWWLNIVDWKTILLVVAILFLVYNFYRDRRREELIKKS